MPLYPPSIIFDPCLAADSSRHRLQVFHDIPIRHAKYPIALAPKPRISGRVSLRLVIVAHSVEFHDQVQVAAEKIDNLRPDRLLPPKLHAAQTTTAKH